MICRNIKSKSFIIIWILIFSPLTGFAQIWGQDNGYNELIEELKSPPAINNGSNLFIPAQDSDWKYKKGTIEASNPTNLWRGLNFQEGQDWLRGKTPIGYGDNDDNTNLDDMRETNSEFSKPYTSVYLRKSFMVKNEQIPSKLLLRVYIDDGAIIWINGIEVARLYVDDDTGNYNDTAFSHEASWESIIIGKSNQLLMEGENIVAVHAFNNSLTSSDFSFDLELASAPFKVSLIEAADAEGRFLPITSPNLSPPRGYSFQGTEKFNNQLITVKTISEQTSYSKSNHAEGVGQRFFSSDSIIPWISEVDVYAANQWASQDFLLSGTPFAPLIEESIIQNHSWISYGYNKNNTPSEVDSIIRFHNEAISRFDYAINRDQFIACVGLNNESSTTVPSILASSYNAIVVGNTNGSHSRGGTPTAPVNSSGIINHDGPGRLKPDIVANDNSTSSCTPQVSSAVTFLYGLSLNQGKPSACYPETMKAIVMAGAQKNEFPEWSRSHEKPIDSVLGAGKINVFNSYKIITESEKITGNLYNNYGWDSGFLEKENASFYNILLDENSTEVVFSLNWNRLVLSAPWINGKEYEESIADMSLSICRVDGENLTPYDFSDSRIDNLEHIYLRGLPKGLYQLKVSTDKPTSYGIAWRAEPGNLPELEITHELGRIKIKCSYLIKGKEFELQKSDNLIDWTTKKTFKASEDSREMIEEINHSEKGLYYRLLWNPIN